MRKKHLRLAKLVNAFHFTGAKHTDATVESYIETWRRMEDNIDKLAEVENVLNFCYQNRHFIRKYPQVVELMKSADSEAAFITFHALGGVYPLRKPGEARVSIGDHLSTLVQAKADNAADTLAAENGLVEIDGKQYCVSLKPGEPGVKVSIDPNTLRNPDGSLNDIVVHGGGRFDRPGISRARLYRDLDTPGVVSEANVESMLIRSSSLSYLTPSDLPRLNPSVEETVLAHVKADGLDQLSPAELRAEAERAVNYVGYIPRHQRKANEAVEVLQNSFIITDEPFVKPEPSDEEPK